MDKRSPGRPPLEHTGKRVQIYLAADLVEWFESLPKGDKSERVNDAIRQAIRQAISK